MNKQKVKKIAQMFEAKRKELRLTQQDVADKSGVSRSKYSQLVNGHVKNPADLHRIGEALGFSEQDIYGDEIREYTLDTAPVCKDKYIVVIESAHMLGLQGLQGNESVNCLVVPWDQESQSQAIRGLFRKFGHTRAVVVSFVPIGDDVSIVPANAPQLSDTLQDLVSGRILGAIQDLVSAADLFRH